MIFYVQPSESEVVNEYMLPFEACCRHICFALLRVQHYCSSFCWKGHKSKGVDSCWTGSNVAKNLTPSRGGRAAFAHSTSPGMLFGR